ncbi:hypothetical protein SmJEL517_g05795 [Synchytrium microbalum]|uniref:Heterokaryon incompatibility domain-containing protein n=1 Tax=Synchytrium microbalum TaxID=1806994 RepID=A0A507BZC0_9FUNG|nr:uncharacterized protein SmJEL517_g05795 [Synchytrium microbalum]TPX30705.1 hypothetical protein SmJEL517_g05795 [Synchytrium microbalum]
MDWTVLCGSDGSTESNIKMVPRSYVALSHVWGTNPDWRSKLFGDSPRPEWAKDAYLRELMDATLRRYRIRLVWTDFCAMPLYTMSNEEVTKRLRMMAQVYADAETVLVPAIFQECPIGNYKLLYAAYLNCRDKVSKVVGRQATIALVKLAKQLYNSKWWTRLWTLQEGILASQIQGYCSSCRSMHRLYGEVGGESGICDVISIFVDWSSNDEVTLDIRPPDVKENISQAVSAIHRLYKLRNRGSEHWIRDLLAEASLRNVSVIHDRVIAISAVLDLRNFDTSWSYEMLLKALADRLESSGDIDKMFIVPGPTCGAYGFCWVAGQTETGWYSRNMVGTLSITRQDYGISLKCYPVTLLPEYEVVNQGKSVFSFTSALFKIVPEQDIRRWYKSINGIKDAQELFNVTKKWHAAKWIEDLTGTGYSPIIASATTGDGFSANVRSIVQVQQLHNAAGITSEVIVNDKVLCKMSAVGGIVPVVLHRPLREGELAVLVNSSINEPGKLLMIIRRAANGSYIRQHATQNRHELALRNSNTTDGRYIIATIPGEFGLGNRFPNLVNGFVLSLLTNRTLFLELPDVMSSVWKFSLDFEIGNRARPTDTVRIIHETEKDTFAISTTENLSAYYDAPERGGVRTWTMHGIDYYIPFWQANPSYRQKLDEIFPDGRVAYHVLRKVVNLNSKLQQILSTHEASNFRPYMVGIHVRAHKVQSIAPMRTYSLVALELAAVSDVAPIDVGFHLATDDESKRGELSTWLGGRATYLPINFSMENAVGNPGGTTEDGALDFIALAISNVVITTFASSFGQWAAAMNGNPYVIVGVGLTDFKDIRAVTSWRTNVAEPCTFSMKSFVGSPEAKSYDLELLMSEYLSALAAGNLTTIEESRRDRAVALLLTSKHYLHHSQCHY